jgi:hypothetical protein
MKESALPKLAVSQQLTQQLELVIAGPEAAPLPRQYWHPLFTAVQINHSKLPVVLLPPRSDWFGERRLEWQAADSKGRWLDRQPNHVIECDVHGVIRAVPDLPPLLVDAQASKNIRDTDLIVLQPGEKYELKSRADPSLSLNLRSHSVYRLWLHFSLASEQLFIS